MDTTSEGKSENLETPPEASESNRNRVPSISSIDSDKLSEKGDPTITNMTEQDFDNIHELLFPGAPLRPPRQEDDDASSQSTDYNELYGNDFDKQVRFTDDEDEESEEMDLEAAAKEVGLDALLMKLKDGESPDIPVETEAEGANKLRVKVLRELRKRYTHN